MEIEEDNLLFVNGRSWIVIGPITADARDVLESNQVRNLTVDCGRGWNGEGLENLHGTSFDYLYINLRGGDPIKEPVDVAAVHLEIDGLGGRRKPPRVSGVEVLYCSRTDDLSFIENVEELRHISISPTIGNGWARGICLPSLRSILLLGAKDLDLSSLAHLKQVEQLILKNCRSLVSLEGVKYLQRLGKLSVGLAPRLEDVTALQHLRHLTQLVLDDCASLKSVKPLSSLKQLELLMLSGTTKVEDGDLSLLDELPALKTVGIRPWPHYKPLSAVMRWVDPIVWPRWARVQLAAENSSET